MRHPSLLDHFSGLDDPRQREKVLYPLPVIMLLILCATLSGAEDFGGIHRISSNKPRSARRAI